MCHAYGERAGEMERDRERATKVRERERWTRLHLKGNGNGKEGVRRPNWCMQIVKEIGNVQKMLQVKLSRSLKTFEVKVLAYHVKWLVWGSFWT